MLLMTLGDQPFLVLRKYHLSESKARQAVNNVLAKFDIDPATIRPDSRVTVAMGNSQVEVTYIELVEQTRSTGVVPHYQEYFDHEDSVFGRTHEMSIPNFQMHFTTRWGGWSQEWRGPGRCCPAERDLTRDILFYRSDVCRNSVDHTLAISSRSYRGYLSAAVSLIEAFMNRYIHLALNEGFSSEAFEQLKEERNLQRRVELWMACFALRSGVSIFDSPQWSKFNELREERNRIVHAISPIAVYDARTMQRFLNYTRDGIGGLMRLLRESRDESIPGFVLRLQTAPRVIYRKIVFKADADDVITEHE